MSKPFLAILLASNMSPSKFTCVLIPPGASSFGSKSKCVSQVCQNKKSEDDLGDGCAAGSGVILVSPTMFRVMGEKLWSELHKMCDDYMDPCLYEKCGMMTGVYDGSFEWVKKYAILATDVYNQQEQKNFTFIKVERLYMISDAYYCMTFWARNDKSDEYRLFRALVCFKDDAEEIFKYVQDDDEFTVFGEVDDAYSPEPCGSVDVLSPHMIEQVRI